MKIISHRGYWQAVSEKNTRMAFLRAFQLGFGIETDIRDFAGEIVISHDMPRGGELRFDEFLKLYNDFGKGLPLALNIKADGLQAAVANLLSKYNIANYFVFDMSIPETLNYCNKHFQYFVRQSEFETITDYHSLLYKNAAGVWLDEFHAHWVGRQVLLEHVVKGKMVCIVSPELHGREYLDVWGQYKQACKNINTDKLMLCTDLPLAAKNFFA